MKLKRIIIMLLVIVTAILGLNRYLFSWGLFNLFTESVENKNGMKRVEAFNPDKDILYLPELSGKDIFSAADDLSICRKRSVRKYIYIYLTSGRKYLVRSLERSYAYRSIIDDVFKENPDIPRDIALLPLLESGFDPFAVSKSDARGLWQFLTNTSRPLGLAHDRWIDERRDIEKSTSAALRHLRNLHRRFKSWDLALAAYNGGGGYIGRTVKKSGAKDIWEMRKRGLLRKETAEYVPKFLAMLVIYKNQRLFGIKDEVTISRPEDTVTIALNKSVKLSDVQRVSGVPVVVLKRLNPQLNKNVTPPTLKRYKLRIPVGVKKKILKKKKYLYRNGISRVIRHRVRKGECVSVIARHYKKKPLGYLNLMV